MAYERKPFFLRGSQENINREMKRLGLPPDAPRGESMRRWIFLLQTRWSPQSSVLRIS